MPERWSSTRRPRREAWIGRMWCVGRVKKRHRERQREWERSKERESEWVGVGREDSRGMPSFSFNRSAQQDSEQGAITDALGLHMLTSTLDFDSCYVNLQPWQEAAACLDKTRTSWNIFLDSNEMWNESHESSKKKLFMGASSVFDKCPTWELQLGDWFIKRKLITTCLNNPFIVSVIFPSKNVPVPAF